MGGATESSPEENRGGHIPRTTEHLPHCLQRYKQYTFNKEGGGGEDNDSHGMDHSVYNSTDQVRGN